jgi:hypothetical protein
MNSDTTIESFEQIMVPFAEMHSQQHPSIKFEWEGDNAAAHTSKKTRAWLNTNEINHYPFGSKRGGSYDGRPPNSPDLCVIEYVFAHWKELVLKRKPKTVRQLMDVANEEWNNISQKSIQNTYRHMVKMLEWVKVNDGKQCLKSL